MDDLLRLLYKEGVDAQGYADDLVVIIRGKHESVISDLMQNALNITNSWCRKKGLNINPKKTSIVPFTNRRKLNIKAPTIDRTMTTISSEAKYLLSDSKLWILEFDLPPKINRLSYNNSGYMKNFLVLFFVFWCKKLF